MIPILIFIFSTFILIVGLLNLHMAHFRIMIFLIFAVALGANALDVFVEGNQTMIRQIAYFAQALSLSYFSLKHPKGYKLK